MNIRDKSLFLIACTMLVILTGCLAQSPEGEVPPAIPSDTFIPPATTTAPTATVELTATPLPTDTAIPPTPTVTLSTEEPVASIDDMVGTWLGYWSDVTTLYIEFTPTGQAIITWDDGSLLNRSSFTLEAGMLKWREILEDPAPTAACLANPVATYEVYITRRGDQPVTLRFVLAGEDFCLERRDLYDGGILRWFEP